MSLNHSQQLIEEVTDDKQRMFGSSIILCRSDDAHAALLVPDFQTTACLTNVMFYWTVGVLFTCSTPSSKSPVLPAALKRVLCFYRSDTRKQPRSRWERSVCEERNVCLCDCEGIVILRLQ